MQKLPNEQIRDQVTAAAKSAMDAARPIYDSWAKNIQQYRLEYPWKAWKKLDHQSKIPLSKVSTKVRYASNSFKRALTENKSEWFVLKAMTPEGEAVIKYMRKIVDDILDREKFPRTLKKALKLGLLCSGPVGRVVPLLGKGEAPYRGYCSVEAVDPRSWIRDPSGRNRFGIEIRVEDYSDLEERAADYGYDLEELEKLKGGGSWSANHPNYDAMKQAAAMADLTSVFDALARPIVLMDYWGPLWDSQKQRVSKFANVTIANGFSTLRVKDDPYGDGKGTVVYGDIEEELSSPYGKSFVADMIPLFEAQTRLFNLGMDAIAEATFTAGAVNVDVLENRSDLSEGKTPGMLLAVHGNPHEVYAKMESGEVAQTWFPMFNTLDKEIQVSSLVPEGAVMGAPDQNATQSKTLGEFQYKSQSANSVLRDTAIELEDNFLEPLIQRLCDFVGRYVSLQDPAVLKLLTKELGPDAQNPQALRMIEQALREPLVVRVRGVSAFMQSQEELQNAMAVLHAANGMAPGIVDSEKAARRIVSLANLDPDDYLFTKEEAAQHQQEQAQQQQQQMAMAQQQAAQQQQGQMLQSAMAGGGTQ